MVKKGNIPWNKGLKTGPQTEAQRRNTSRILKEMFADGKIKKKYGANNNRWIGGSRMYFHYKAREVMEKRIGRKLLSGEVVHHIDQNYKNNDSNNLYLFETMLKHNKHHTNLIQMIVDEIGYKIKIGNLYYKPRGDLDFCL